MSELACEAKVMQLFALFAHLKSPEDYRDLAEAAIAQVSRILKPDADPADPRLAYYAAALANLQYRRLRAAQDTVSPTYAGSVTAHRNESIPCTLAERLAAAYRDAAANLLTDDGFVFAGIR